MPRFSRSLTQGDHVITLQATDQAGASNSTSVSITVNPMGGGRPPSAQIFRTCRWLRLPTGNTHPLRGQRLRSRRRGASPEQSVLVVEHRRIPRHGPCELDKVLSPPTDHCNPDDFAIHILTLTVTDSDGNRSTFSILVKVGAILLNRHGGNFMRHSQMNVLATMRSSICAALAVGALLASGCHDRGTADHRKPATVRAARHRGTDDAASMEDRRQLHGRRPGHLQQHRLRVPAGPHIANRVGGRPRPRRCGSAPPRRTTSRGPIRPTTSSACGSPTRTFFTSACNSTCPSPTGRPAWRGRCGRTSPDATVVVDTTIAPTNPAVDPFEDGTPRVIGTIARPGQTPPEALVLDEIGLSPMSDADLLAFNTRWGGVTLRRGVTGTGGAPPQNAGDLGPLVRINPATAPLSQLGRLLALRGVQGTVRFSSERAQRLLAIALSDARATPNVMLGTGRRSHSRTSQ